MVFSRELRAEAGSGWLYAGRESPNGVNRMTSRITHILLVLGVFLWSFAAGASESPADQPAQNGATSQPNLVVTPGQVEARAGGYLEALRLQDWQTVYRMELGSKDGTLSPLAFMQQFANRGAKVLQYEITNVSVGGPGAASADATVTYNLPQLFKPYTAPLHTDWVLRDGQLYRYHPKEPWAGAPGDTAERIRKMLQ